MTAVMAGPTGGPIRDPSHEITTSDDGGMSAAGRKPIVGWGRSRALGSGSAGWSPGGSEAPGPKPVIECAVRPAGCQPRRGRARGQVETRARPKTDAWKWQGVPPGRASWIPSNRADSAATSTTTSWARSMQLPPAWPPDDAGGETGEPPGGARTASVRGNGVARWRGGGRVRSSPSPSDSDLRRARATRRAQRAGVAAAVGVLCSTAPWPPCRWRDARVTSGCPSPCAGRRGGRGRRVAGRWRRVCEACACCEPGGRTWASCTTGRARTLTAALSLRGRSFALLGPDEQDRRVGAWSSVLASLAREGSPVHRVQWLAASFPDDGRGVHVYLAAEAVADAGSAVRRLVRGAAGRHGLARLHARRGAGRPGAPDEVGRGGVRGARPRGRVLVRAAGRCRRAGGVGAQRRGPGPPVAAHLRGRHPERGGGAGGRPVADGDGGDLVERVGSTAWSHATFWVAEWPRIEVRSDFLAPLLLGSARSTSGGGDGTARARMPRCAKWRRRARRTSLTPSCGAGAASSRRRVTCASRRCWPAVRRSWRRATHPSVIRAS